MISLHRSVNSARYSYKVRSYAKAFGAAKEIIQANPKAALHNLFNDSRDMFAVEAVVNPNSENGWVYLQRAQQLGTGHFESLLNDGQEFLVELDGENIPVIGAYENHFSNVNYWLKAFHCAVITRNGKAIETLSRVPEEVFRADALGSTDFECALAALFKGIFNPDADLAKLLIDATATFNADELSDERFFYVSRILLPLTPLIRTIFTANAEKEFNQEMEKALLLHQEYWVKTSDVAAEGLVSLPLTAVAVLAQHHKDYRVTIENEYIPDWVVNRM